MWWMAAGAIWAGPPAELARFDEPRTLRDWGRVDGVGPVRVRYRRRSGPVEAWTFPDGLVSRYRLKERGEVLEDRRFDAAGLPVSAVFFTDGAAVRVEIPGSEPIDVAGWAAAEVGRARVRAPVPPVDGAFAWDGGVLTLDLRSGIDPTGDALRDAIEADCGCVVEDRAAAWIDGWPAVRMSVDIPHPSEPERALVWAVPLGDQTWTATWRTAGALAPGRAALALVELLEDP